MDNTTSKLMFSSKSNEWSTPQTFYEKLHRLFNFTLDPCSNHTNNKCDKHYTVEEDGLLKSWKGETVFVNPPYSDVGKWVQKSYEESVNNGATVALLIPVRTDTKYWHDYIMKGASTIYFIKGRLKFENDNGIGLNAAPFPSAVIVFSGYKWTPGIRIETMER
jgi:phage N-6-adenine-methyltransferase